MCSAAAYPCGIKSYDKLARQEGVDHLDDEVHEGLNSDVGLKADIAECSLRSDMYCCIFPQTRVIVRLKEIYVKQSLENGRNSCVWQSRISKNLYKKLSFIEVCFLLKVVFLPWSSSIEGRL